ncbi:GTPase Era [Andreesenia angusta]|uniref:GTPase Era n=1 Tax=Andreesenia angusta TaxID=39480 RepID=A0A1S1V7G2_9FIRM|nr:GTPase Era [Andreesenia angusta]OHW62566.1 GTPase Era [Andreesenia angusta]
MTYKSGFVTIIGRPNVGKSTLMNRLVGEKIAIISDKPQTTRNRIQTVYTDENMQAIFLDTPGIHKPKNKLGDYMVSVSTETLGEVDLILWLVDESVEIGPGDKYILEQIQDIKTPKILVVNKVDKIPIDKIQGIIDSYSEFGVFEDIVAISATMGSGVEDLMKKIRETLPEGPQYFPEDTLTDQPERVIVSEIIREKALLYLEDEVPHGVAVGIESMKKRPKKDLVDIDAVIYCERDSHKGIIIGKGGRKLKGIGKSAREDIERLLGSQVNLKVWVKVEKNWRDKEKFIKQFGYI